MGIRDLFGGSRLYNEATGAGSNNVKSPWSDNSHLAAVLLPDIFENTVTMADALSVPPVSRALQLYSTVTAGMPLAGEGVPGYQDAWLDGTAGAVTARHRSAFTVQDLIFTGASCWVKDVVDADGYALQMSRVPRHLWALDAQGYVVNLDGAQIDPRRVVYIPALLELGFLSTGAETIRHYKYLGKQILNRSRGGKPLLDLHISDATMEPDEDEAEKVLEDWTAARLSENGAVAFSPAWLDVRELGTSEVSMLQEARNAVRLDVANFLNINAAMLDGNNGTSDTYSNTLQNTNELLQLSMRNYLAPIEHRLSQDDVTPPGYRVRFDTSEFDAIAADAAGNTGTAVAPTPADQEA